MIHLDVHVELDCDREKAFDAFVDPRRLIGRMKQIETVEHVSGPEGVETGSVYDIGYKIQGQRIKRRLETRYADRPRYVEQVGVDKSSDLSAVVNVVETDKGCRAEFHYEYRVTSKFFKFLEGLVASSLRRQIVKALKDVAEAGKLECEITVVSGSAWGMPIGLARIVNLGLFILIIHFAVRLLYG